MFPGVIKASTWDAAKAIKREDSGNLSVEADADVAILNIRKGNFGYYDYTGFKLNGSQKFQCEMTIRDGMIVYDLNGIANPIVAAPSTATSRH